MKASYAERLLHKVPDAPVVDRGKFLVQRCQGKRVLDYGASGLMHEAIKKVATDYFGVDRTASDGVMALFDLDDVTIHSLAGSAQWNSGCFARDPELIVCGEVLEHLTNPGHFLRRLKAQYAGVPVLITVPNAFSAGAAEHMRTGVENVNLDHTCWYSYYTLKGLLEKCGYTIQEWAWYRGHPFTAEGLIVVCV